MAGCGCVGTCDCFIEGTGLTTVTGTGDVTDPYVINSTQTDFALTALDNALQVTPGGVQGHAPSIALVLDPASTAPVEITGAGLKVDCCDPEDAAISPDDCNELVDAGNGLYVDSGGTLLDPGGTNVRSIPSGGNVSADSWNRTVTNNEDCDILVRAAGNPVAVLTTSSGAVALYLDIAFRLVISGGTWLGGGTIRSARSYLYDPNVPSGGELYSAALMMQDYALIPAGASRTFSSVIATTRRQNHASSTFEFQTPTLMAWRVRRSNLNVVAA